MKRIAIPLFIITTIVSSLHLFIYLMATNSFATAPLWLVGVMVFGVALAPASLLIGISSLRHRLWWITLLGHIWIGIFFIAFFFSAIQLMFLIFSVPVHSSWVLFATVIISLWSARISFFAPKIITHKIKGPDFLKGLRLVQISDLHIGMPLLKKPWLQTVVDQIKSTKADILVITGDLVDAPYEDVAHMLEPLAQIHIPKFYVTGNHEYIRGGDWEQKLKDLGFHVLHNSNEIISRNNGKLLIAGVPDRRVNGFHRKLESNPDLSLQTKTAVDYKILLAHEPGSVFDLRSEKCDLILSGHTHGGQIFPFGFFARLVNPVVSGFKTIKSIRVFAHQGTGYWGPPMRWFTRCEIVIFEYYV